MYDSKFLEDTIQEVFASATHFMLPKGIVRFDYSNDHGWYVRLTRNRAKFQKLFCDSQFDGYEGSLKEAILYRHHILLENPITLIQVHCRSLPPEPENRIKRLTDTSRGWIYEYWEARYYDKNHKVKHKAFSVARYGEETAKELAYNVAKKYHNKKLKITHLPDTYSKRTYRRILRSEVEHNSKIKGKSKSDFHHTSINPIVSDPFAFEGTIKLELHRSIERDKKLRDEKLRRFLENNEKLFCQLCGFSFSEHYNFLEKDIIEVHHIVPLSALTTSTKTKLSDLVLVCSNCHFAIHQGDAVDNFLEAMIQFKVDLLQ